MQNTSFIYKGIWAVFAGLLLFAVLSIIGDLLLRSWFPTTFGHSGANLTPIAALVILSYGAVFAALSGYLTARLASIRPAMHATVLGGVLFLFSLLGVVGSRAPLWFNVGFLVILFPSVWTGALTRIRQASV